MSARACGNCKKTVYVNEKMDAEGRWYHRPCFKCMAPNCNTPLTLRTFQMAALDDSVLDESTRRPLKVLVCKEHVPKPKHTHYAHALSKKHTAISTSKSNDVLKPSIPGLHRSLMGERGFKGGVPMVSATSGGAVGGSSGHGSVEKGLGSPRSLDQGSHAEILKGLQAEKGKQNKEDRDVERGEPDRSHAHKDNREPQHKQHSDEVQSIPLSGLTVTGATDSVTASHTEAEKALDLTKDDDSYRTLPVRHGDYGHHEGHTAKDEDDDMTTKKRNQEAEDEENEDSKQERDFTKNNIHTTTATTKSFGTGRNYDDYDIDASLETTEDVAERVHRDHLNVNLEDLKQVEAAEIKAPHGDAEEHKLVDMAFSSKMMQQRQKQGGDTPDGEDQAVDDSEWDAAPMDTFSRRAPVAGM
ncbi:hypothetical protein BG011_002376 [Mortierella polycephala]|uniref:LIM zinc-binding domain-containing protein n=1 Tax=Mortierella polycephala TaxID=41804 RepID=A0A9P6U4T5_9FUNG|nr:hypothetical protein BG011_002376 [Mortierella polycephala]